MQQLRFEAGAAAYKHSSVRRGESADPYLISLASSVDSAMAAVMAEYATVGEALPPSSREPLSSPPSRPVPIPMMMAASSSLSKQYRVRNVDAKGRIIHVGYLEVGEDGVMFRFEHYPAEAIRWPLTCIRRYGVNAVTGVLALEVGRRAPTGEGHFGFRAEEADEICTLLDHYTNSSGRVWQV